MNSARTAALVLALGLTHAACTTDGNVYESAPPKPDSGVPLGGAMEPTTLGTLEVDDRTPAGPLQVIGVETRRLSDRIQLIGRVENRGEQTVCRIYVASGLLVDAESQVLEAFTASLIGHAGIVGDRLQDDCLAPGESGVFVETALEDQPEAIARLAGVELVLTASEEPVLDPGEGLALAGEPDVTAYGELIAVNGRLTNLALFPIETKYFPLVLVLEDAEGRWVDVDYVSVGPDVLPPGTEVDFQASLTPGPAGFGRLHAFLRWRLPD
jgi:hypothetical protein